MSAPLRPDPAEPSGYVDCGECPRVTTGCMTRCMKAEAQHTVRYCFQCGHIGAVEHTYLACCPDNEGYIVTRKIAEQARAGLLASLATREGTT